MRNKCEGSCGSTMEIGTGRRQSGNSGQLSLYVISCGRGVELTTRDKISCAWSKWRKEQRLTVCEACIAVCCGKLGTNRKTERAAS